MAYSMQHGKGRFDSDAWWGQGYIENWRLRESLICRWERNWDSMQQFDSALPDCIRCVAAPQTSVIQQSQSQIDQEINQQTCRQAAKDLWLADVPASYYHIRQALKFSATNTTVRKVYSEMTLLYGVQQDPSEYNAQWIREKNYKENVKIAIDLLSSYEGGDYPCANDGRVNVEYWFIKEFISVSNTTKTVRAIAAILQDERQNPWDENCGAYTLQQYVYYLISLWQFRIHVFVSFVVLEHIKTKKETIFIEALIF